MITEAVELIHTEIISNFSSYPPPPPEFLGERSLIVGWHSEQRVAQVLQTIDQVAEVRPTKHGSPEDNQLIDLFVRLDQEYSIPNLDELKVQVKSSPRGTHHFRKRLADILVETHLPCDENTKILWMLTNGMILINGGYKYDCHGKCTMVTDEDIIQSFSDQLKQISTFHHPLNLPLRRFCA